MRSTRSRLGTWGAWAALAAGLAGCHGGPLRVADPAARLPAGEDSAAFLDRTASQKHVTENDALRGFLLLLGIPEADWTFQQRVERLAQQGVVDRSWDFVADRALTRGKLAYMTYQACRMEGGLLLWLTGPSQRYCLRELQYREMMGPGSGLAPVTGMEFVAVLTRADIYLRTGQVPDKVGDTEAKGQ